jgi:DNA-binding response OmpR family regulator
VGTKQEDRVKRRVLVVDDDALIREIVSTILDLEHFEVRTADGGEAALAAVADEVPDVMVLDVMMPDLDGYEVCARMRAQPETADLPIVLLTARDQREDRQAGIDAGADAYLTKPFSPLKLIETISNLDGADGRRGREEA